MEELYPLLLSFIWWKNEESYFDILWDILWHRSYYEHGNKQPCVAMDPGNESTYFWHPGVSQTGNLFFLPFLTFPAGSCCRSPLIIIGVLQRCHNKWNSSSNWKKRKSTSYELASSSCSSRCYFAFLRFHRAESPNIWHRIIWLLYRFCEN